jgi:hypothetical protein
VSFSIFPSPSVRPLPFSIHLFLSAEFSHLSMFSRLLNFTTITYFGFDSSDDLIRFTPRCPSNRKDSRMNPCTLRLSIDRIQKELDS